MLKAAASFFCATPIFSMTSASCHPMETCETASKCPEYGVARARRERRRRAEARLRLVLVRDGYLLANHRGGPGRQRKETVLKEYDEFRRNAETLLSSSEERCAVLENQLSSIAKELEYALMVAADYAGHAERKLIEIEQVDAAPEVALLEETCEQPPTQVQGTSKDAVADQRQMDKEPRKIPEQVQSTGEHAAADQRPVDKVPKQLAKAEARLEVIERRIADQERILEGTKSKEKLMMAQKQMLTLGKLKCAILDGPIAIEETGDRS